MKVVSNKETICGFCVVVHMKGPNFGSTKNPLNLEIVTVIHNSYSIKILRVRKYFNLLKCEFNLLSIYNIINLRVFNYFNAYNSITLRLLTEVIWQK